MQINNKKICIKYSTNIFLAFVAAVIAGGKRNLSSYQEVQHFYFAEIASLACVLISVPQFTERNQRYITELGACYYIEVSHRKRDEQLSTFSVDLPHIRQPPPHSSVLSQLQQSKKIKLPRPEKSVRDQFRELRVGVSYET